MREINLHIHLYLPLALVGARTEPAARPPQEAPRTLRGVWKTMQFSMLSGLSG